MICMDRSNSNILMKWLRMTVCGLLAIFSIMFFKIDAYAATIDISGDPKSSNVGTTSYSFTEGGVEYNGYYTITIGTSSSAKGSCTYCVTSRKVIMPGSSKDLTFNASTVSAI